MNIHRWWDQDPDEIYWLEITNRPDVGNDLHAPALADSGAPTPSYQLITEVNDGEIVFHYEKGAKGITSWSVAEGGFWEAETIWELLVRRGEVGRRLSHMCVMASGTA